MRKFLILSSLIFLFTSASTSAIELDKFSLPEQLSTKEGSLGLNGAGIRTKTFFDLYMVGLYLTQNSSHSDNIINADENMAIRLHIISAKITSEKMIRATRDGFEKSSNGNTTGITSEIVQFLNAFSDPIKEGDIFEFIYFQGQGLTVKKNGNTITVIPSLIFKQALFGIWLSDQPVQKKLKNALLGK